MSMCGNGALENAVDPGTVKEGGELPLGLPPLFSPNPSKEGDSEEPRAPLPPPGGPEGKATSPTGKNSGRRAPGEEECLPSVRHDEVRGVEPLEEVALNDSLRAYDGCSLSEGEGEGESEVRAFDFDFDASPVIDLEFEQKRETSDTEQISALSSDIMSVCGNPSYKKASFVNEDSKVLKDAFTALRIKFKFPDSIKFPPIPVSLDKNITIYPLEGESLITGLEYISAKNILNQALYILSTTKFIKIDDLKKKYFIKIIHGINIPFEKEKPFFPVINELQENRRRWKKATGKGSAMERIYKDLGNMLYGKTVCGISQKPMFDSRHEQMKALQGSNLTNPIIGT
jgi:hypothetical protein